MAPLPLVPGDAGYGFWIIESLDGSALLGTVGFREASWEPGVCELAYSLQPDWWGQGIMTEVARAADFEGVIQSDGPTARRSDTPRGTQRPTALQYSSYSAPN